MRGVISLIIRIAAILAIPEVEVGFKAKVVLQGLQTIAGHPLGEALVQPEVVPPHHGDVVSEPVVGELVGDHQTCDVVVVFGRVLWKHSRLVEGHDSCVLHCECSEFSDKYLIVFVKREL
jgi:hypothetical protein